MAIDNLNNLSPNGFKVVINKSKLEHFTYFVQRVQHPSVEVTSTEVPHKRLTSVAFIGGKMVNSELILDVLMDEDMKSYAEIFKWFTDITELQHRLTPYQEEESSYADIVVEIFTSHNNPNRKIKYYNALPTSLGDIEFSAISDGEYITFPVGFRFDYFEII
jgi:hypothetical protein